MVRISEPAERRGVDSALGLVTRIDFNPVFIHFATRPEAGKGVTDVNHDIVDIRGGIRVRGRFATGEGKGQGEDRGETEDEIEAHETVDRLGETVCQTPLPQLFRILKYLIKQEVADRDGAVAPIAGGRSFLPAAGGVGREPPRRRHQASHGDP
jgi:hypothetical protein